MEGWIHNIGYWIRHYQPKNEEERESLSDFHIKLCSVNSLDDLDRLLTEFYVPSEYEKGNLVQKKIKEWQTTCAKITIGLERVIPILESIKDDNTGLIAFCWQQLSRPQTLFHYRIMSILSILDNADTLQSLILFLKELPDNPNPISTAPSTFEAQKPTDELHRNMIKLLRNNSYQFGKSQETDLLNMANGLLQSLLIVHKDGQKPLDPIEELDWTDNSNRCCLM